MGIALFADAAIGNVQEKNMVSFKPDNTEVVSCPATQSFLFIFIYPYYYYRKNRFLCLRGNYTFFFIRMSTFMRAFVRF